tara:strand:+ start:465 stop:824 length:360 start_codon:yes stop_codon:yes gene_type:complete
LIKSAIKLENLEFFGYHGIYDNEKVDGQVFVINIYISMKNDFSTDNIDSSIDYVKLYEFIKDSFNAKRFNLIESLAHKIINDLVSHFKIIDNINISIRKPSISIDGNKDFINVQLEYSR